MRWRPGGLGLLEDAQPPGIGTGAHSTQAAWTYHAKPPFP